MLCRLRGYVLRHHLRTFKQAHIHLARDARWHSWLKHRAGSWKSRLRFPMVSEFFIGLILPAPLWPWSWLSLQQKWVKGVSPGGWRGPMLYHFHVPIAWYLGASTSWNHLGLYKHCCTFYHYVNSQLFRCATLLGTTSTCTVTQFVLCLNPYPTAFPYGNGMVLHFYQQQESSTTKTVHRVINKGLKVYV